MSFELDALVIERECEPSPLARRVLAAISPGVAVTRVEDGRAAARPDPDSRDSFGAGKRKMVIMRRRAQFVNACPAGSAAFACCGYMVLNVASNCPMDCSYCFLQEYLADNPALQIYANYADAFAELERIGRAAPQRHFRIGTGELADSLAFDSLTGIAPELVEFFASAPNLCLELKTKTDEISGLLRIDPRGNTLVSWTLSPEAVYRSSERGTAPPRARIAAARRVLEAGYRVAFHFDPLIAYPGAEHDYAALIEELLDAIPPEQIAFASLGGLRMTPGLRAAARRRHPNDAMLTGEEVLAPDGRYRAFTPLRLGLYRVLERHLGAHKINVYLCMEPPSVHRHVLGRTQSAGALGERLAGG